MGTGQDKRGAPWKVLSRKPQSKHENTITKPEMTGVPKEPKDTGIFLEGLRFGREDH